MSKLNFKMDDFGIHESISYEMRDRLRYSIQKKFDDWFDENHKNRRIGPYKIAPFGEDSYAIYKGEETLRVSKVSLEKLIEEFYNSNQEKTE